MMHAAGTIAGIAWWVLVMFGVLIQLEINPWWSPFVGLVVAGAYLLVAAVASRLATIAGALDVKSRAEQRLSPEQAAEGLRAILGPKGDEKAAPN